MANNSRSSFFPYTIVACKKGWFYKHPITNTFPTSYSLEFSDRMQFHIWNRDRRWVGLVFGGFGHGVTSLFERDLGDGAKKGLNTLRENTTFPSHSPLLPYTFHCIMFTTLWTSTRVCHNKRHLPHHRIHSSEQRVKDTNFSPQQV